MARKHALVVSLFLGLAMAAGALAAVRTAQLGQASTKTSTSKSELAQILKRERLLNRQQIALERALGKRPPKLPKVPKFKPPAPAPAAAPVAAAAVAPSAQPTVQYVRPAPIIVTKHRSHGDDGEHQGGGDD